VRGFPQMRIFWARRAFYSSHESAQGVRVFGFGERNISTVSQKHTLAMIMLSNSLRHPEDLQ
jgi:hypothetical protein